MFDKPENRFAVEGCVSGVSSYAMNSTISAYNELENIKDSKPEDYKEKKKELDKNWEKLAKFQSRLLIINSFLTFSPTFVFGILVFSLISTPQNLNATGIIFGIFSICLSVALIYKVHYQKNEISTNFIVTELEKDIKKLQK